MKKRSPAAQGRPAPQRALVRAVTETLEPRRLMAAPVVEQPPAYPVQGEPVGPDGHLHFEYAPGQQVKVDFDQSVTLASNAMSLLNLTTGQPSTQLTQTNPEPGATRTWDVGYADPDVWIGVLPRGNYEVLLDADKVTNTADEKLDGNRDGTGGDDYVHGFFFQPGDANHDRVVDGADYGAIDNYVQFPGTDGFSNGDFNYDDVIDGADYGVIDNWHGTALPPPPDQPNELAAAAARGYIDLYWTAPADVDADGFNIYRSLDAGDTWALYHTVANPAARSWRDEGPDGEGLTDGTKYTYRIRAYSDTDGLSMTTNKVWSVTNLPGALEAAKASLIASDALTLTWNDNSTNESGFEIEQIGPGGVVTIIPVTGANNEATKSFRVTGLTAASSYSFRVRALTAAQTSAWSPSTSATTLAAGVPVGPSHVGGVSGSWWTTTLSWVNNADNEDGFYIQQWGVDGQWHTIATTGPGATSFTIDEDVSDLTSATTYTYQVVAFNEHGSSTADGSDGSGTDGSGGSGDDAADGDTGENSGAGSSAVSVTTGEAFGEIFNSMDFFVHEKVSAQWSGPGFNADGTRDPNAQPLGNGDEVTVTITGLPPHGAIGVSANPGFMPDPEEGIVFTTKVDTETPDTAETLGLIEHSGTSVTVTMSITGLAPESYWWPVLSVGMETPVLHGLGAVLTVGAPGETTVWATTHGGYGGVAQPWPFDLTLTAEYSPGGIISVQGPINIPAGQGRTTVALAAPAPGSTTVRVKNDEIGAASKPATQTALKLVPDWKRPANVAQLIADLASDDPDVRLAARLELGQAAHRYHEIYDSLRQALPNAVSPSHEDEIKAIIAQQAIKLTFDGNQLTVAPRAEDAQGVTDVWVTLTTARPNELVPVTTSSDTAKYAVFAEKPGGPAGVSFPLHAGTEGVATLEIDMLITRDDGVRQVQWMRKQKFHVRSTKNPQP